jgi:hypothetical protein
MNPPGYAPTQVNVDFLRGVQRRGAAGTFRNLSTRDGRLLPRDQMTVENMIDAGIVFAGTPDMVFRQISDFYEHVGGFGHLLMQAQGAYMSHEDTVENVTLFAKEVLPRLQELQLFKMAG